MLNENRAWVMSILKDSESSKKIDCVINTVETASRLIVHAIIILDLSDFRTDLGKAVSLISYFCSNISYSMTCFFLSRWDIRTKYRKFFFAKARNVCGLSQYPAVG